MAYKQLNYTAAQIDDLLASADTNLENLGEDNILVGDALGKAQRVSASSYMGDATIKMELQENVNIESGNYDYPHGLETKHILKVEVYDNAGKPVSVQLKTRTATHFRLYKKTGVTGANILVTGKKVSETP